jgi:protein-tyrosine kinase
LSVIETSLEKLRRAGAASASAAAVIAPAPIAAVAPATGRPEAVTPLESAFVHKRFAIDLARLSAEGYVPEAGQERRFADSCHRIKRPLIARALAAGTARDARLIMLSGALPGDGKTFIALNLALSMARERDVSLLLVDGDLPKARITRLFGLLGERGLLDALRDERLDVESLVLKSDLPGLAFLPAGAHPEGAAELISSTRMRDVADRLLSRNPRRLVLFDSPPLLVSSEARALAQIPGQIVLVARAGRTPQRAVTDAIAQIDKAKLQGLVLNDAYVGVEQAYYDYYGYGEPVDTVAKQPAR